MSNIQCEECTGWVHKQADGGVLTPITCQHQIKCKIKASAIETWCLEMSKWNDKTA